MGSSFALFEYVTETTLLHCISHSECSGAAMGQPFHGTPRPSALKTHRIWIIPTLGRGVSAALEDKEYDVLAQSTHFEPPEQRF